MKKNFQILIILLIVVNNSLFNIVFAAESNLQTDKSIHAVVQKKNENYEVIKLDIAIEKCSYQDNYNAFKGKDSNGVIVSFKNEKLAYFSVPDNLEVSFCEDSINVATRKIEGGCHDLREGKLVINMPYFPNDKYADIYDLYGKKILTIDLSSKATCNENDQCDRPVEDSENCPQDCKNGEPKLDPAVVQLAANNPPATQETKQAEDGIISLADLGWWRIAILIVILLAGGGIGYWVYRRNKEA
jgi:hypothetical protein